MNNSMREGIPKPPMGWNPWSAIGTNIDTSIVKEHAKILIDTGLQDAGYLYVNLDGGGNYGNNEAAPSALWHTTLPLQIWTRELVNNRRAVCIVNRSYGSIECTIPWPVIGKKPTSAIRDVIQKIDLEISDVESSITLPPHGCLLLRCD